MSLAHSQQNIPVQQSNTNFLPPVLESEQLWKWASLLAQSPFYNKLGAGGVAAVILTARELKIPVMAALNGGLYTFDGKVSISGQMMNVMILRSGHSAKIITSNKEICTIRFQRKEWDYHIDHSFTVDEAKDAGLLKKDNWTKYPKAMLFNRCISSGSRLYMPDVIGPYYTPEEIGVSYEIYSSEIEMESAQIQTADIAPPKEDNTLSNQGNAPQPITDLLPKPPEPVISAEQLNDFKLQLELCDETFRNNMLENITKHFQSDDKIPLRGYAIWMDRIKNNIIENAKKGE